jgi:hypothetical protein
MYVFGEKILREVSAQRLNLNTRDSACFKNNASEGSCITATLQMGRCAAVQQFQTLLLRQDVN